MAVAVVGGQIYIGSGYRKMAEVTKSALNKFTCLSRYGDVSLREYNKTREFE